MAEQAQPLLATRGIGDEHRDPVDLPMRPESATHPRCDRCGARLVERGKIHHGDDDDDRAYGRLDERTKLAVAPRHDVGPPVLTSLLKARISHQALFTGQFLVFAIVVIQFTMLYRNYMLAASVAAISVDAAAVKRQSGAPPASTSTSSSSAIPDYYVTMPELVPGMH